MVIPKYAFTYPDSNSCMSPYSINNAFNSRNNQDKKGGRGGRIPAHDGKRAYDRQSGTGCGKEIKKEGGGGHNWGSEKINAKKAEGPVTKGVEEINTPKEEPEKEVAAEAAVEAKEPETEPELEDNTLCPTTNTWP